MVREEINMKKLSPRQIHLDFHTSEKIPDVAQNFSAEEFARQMKEAHVSSVTVFARCHHGWLYYPSKKFPELVHPALKNKNLLIDQVKSLHKVGIRAPIYITVQWDYQSANKHPEWLIRKRDGSHEGPAFTEAGFYQSLCVNTGYKDFLMAQTAEICEILGDELDGIFFDIVGTRPCLCSACRAEMKREGLDLCDDVQVRNFAARVMDRFKSEMTSLVRKFSTDCTVFYNAGHVGPCTKKSKDAYSHFELESLPSGSWGYLHFPVTARYARTLGKDCLGMTGKFHTDWGDFHSLKNQAALEFECFRMLSYGFASSIGDQLEPGGILNPATYRLIGSVYKQFEEREEWARPSIPMTEALLLTSEPDNVESKIPESVMGAAQLFEELALQFDISDKNCDFGKYKLLIIPEDFRGDAEFSDKVNEYVSNGGKVLAFGKGGLTADNCYPECFGVKYEGKTEKYPDFIVADGELSSGLEIGNGYVIYLQGEQVSPITAEPVLYARAPYFRRDGDYFCSHKYTPSAKGASYPVAFLSKGVVFFSHHILTQYRKNAPYWCKKLVSNAVKMLLGEQMITHNGPSTLSVSVLSQPEKGRVNLHLLSYIPVRKSATIDIIEERTVVRNVKIKLNLDKKFKKARLVPENTILNYEDGEVEIPEVNGYAIVELS